MGGPTSPVPWDTFAQGDVLYYDGVTFRRLAPGTSGQVLTTAGPAANPSWATPSAGVSQGYVDAADALRVLKAGDTMTGALTINMGSALPPLVLGANGQGQKVIGLNADLLDGLDSAAFSLAGHSHTLSEVIALTDLSDTTISSPQSTHVLHYNGSSWVNAAIVAGDLPTIPITGGGTGQTTASAAFDALAPTTTRGDLIYRGASSNLRLAAGTSGYVLTANGAGADPSWQAASTPDLSAYFKKDGSVAMTGVATMAGVKLGYTQMVYVDSGGKGDYTTIQAAINAVSPSSSNPVLIEVGPGVYAENLTIASKSYLTIRGAGAIQTKVAGTDNTKPGIEFTGSTANVLIDSMTIDPNTSNSASGGKGAICPNMTSGAQVVEFRDCYFANTGGSAYLLRGAGSGGTCNMFDCVFTPTSNNGYATPGTFYVFGGFGLAAGFGVTEAYNFRSAFKVSSGTYFSCEFAGVSGTSVACYSCVITGGLDNMSSGVFVSCRFTAGNHVFGGASSTLVGCTWAGGTLFTTSSAAVTAIDCHFGTAPSLQGGTFSYMACYFASAPTPQTGETPLAVSNLRAADLHAGNTAFQVTLGNATSIGAVFKGAALASGDLTRWLKSDDTVYSEVDSAGRHLVPAGALATCGLAIHGDPNTGLFAPAADDIALVAGASNILEVLLAGGVPKVGVFAVPPVARAGALTQTYATADRTLSAYTSDPESGAYTGIDNLQIGTPYAQLTDLNSLRVAYENLRAFAEDLAQFVNSLVDDQQAYGWEQ